MILITYLTMCHSTDSNYTLGGVTVSSTDGVTVSSTGSATCPCTSRTIYEIFGSDSEDGDGDDVYVLNLPHDDLDDNHDDDDDDDDDDESISSTCDNAQYVGLKQLAYIIGICAHRLSACNRVPIAEQLYMDALSIDPFHEFIGNMAIMYETQLKNIELARKYYLMAIENDDEIAMYNLADMYSNDKNTALMVQYFEMAVQHGDSASRKRLIMHYHKEADMPNFAKHYYTHLLDDDSEYHDWDGDDDDDFGIFQHGNSRLAIATHLDSIVNKEKEAATIDAHVLQLREHLHKRPEYCAFKNKVSLFTRLNHVVECGICYDDDKVNIDIHCGHTVCVDCYTMVYDKACPFCRQAPHSAIGA